MAYLDVRLDGDGELNDWIDDDRGNVTHLTEATGCETRGIRLPGGMKSGKSSVCLAARAPDGKVYIIETSLDLLDGFVKACRGADEYDKNRAKSAH